MDLLLTDDQKLFQETTARFIQDRSPLPVVRELHDDPAGFRRDWLRQAAELGWFAMLVPEDQGGGNVSGDGLVDATIVADQLGRNVQPGPFIPMNVVASSIVRHGSPQQQADLLAAIVAGERVATWAPLDADGEWDRGGGLAATTAGERHRLSGVRGYVQDGQNADVVLVSATIDSRPAQFIVSTEAEGVTVTPLVSFDLSRRFAEIRFDDAPGELLGTVDASEEFDQQLRVALALVNAETVGALDAMFEMTVAYAKDRTAFGRPIGSFQALKHIMADLGLWVETAKAGAAELARAVQQGRADAMALAHIVSAFIGDVATDIAQECLQIHGGIGYTWEHDLHLLMRRTRTNSTLYGEPVWHREQLCNVHGLGEVA